MEIDIIATPPEEAEGIARCLADAGVSAVLSFAPIELGDRDPMVVRTMDLALELEGLTFALTSARKWEG